MLKRLFPKKDLAKQAKKAPEEIALERIEDNSKTLSEFLYLTDLELTHLPSQLWQLVHLKHLYLSGNNLEILPADIGNLTNLETLDLHSEVGVGWGGEYGWVGWQLKNKLTTLPSSIGKLKRLKILNLSENSIKSLPHEILSLTNLTELDLSKNELSIPDEIILKIHDPQAILNYYFSIIEVTTQNSELTGSDIEVKVITTKYINETKLILVGQGNVGKTSIVRRLIRNDFDESETKTEGISINRWQVERQSLTENQQSKIQLNIWDFGGQEIMHATHQFFLTKRSVYVLVLDVRLSEEENRVEYWLKIVQSYGSESPVLIVGNKIDQHQLDIDRTGLQKKYPNIVGILETSAATGAGIEALKTAIADQVNNMPHVRDLLPETWFTIKTKLEDLGRESNFITHDKYLELCAENEVGDETSQRTLIGFMHDLGVVLYFQEDRRLSDLGILNPQWVTNGVYKILNSKTLFQNKGVLTISMLDEILNLPEYPRGKRLFIVDMMKKFELCYDLETDKTFLIPDLLPKDEPAELKFNGIPAFEYAYPVLPSSVVTRFIVRMNQKIHDGLVWRTGVVLKIGENTALVKADIEDRKITIAVDGLEHTRRDSLSAIRYQLDEIHNSIKGLNPEKYIPVPGAINAKSLKYEYLLKLERAGRETLLVENGNELKEINISQVLNGVESEYQRKQIGGNVTNNFNINIGKKAKVGDIILASQIQNSFNKADSANIQPELKETLKQLAEAVNAMNKSLPEAQVAEVTEDLAKLVDEATKSKPNKKWYSVSIDGLIKAAENVEKVGEPVINLSRKVLSLLLGGAIQ